MDDAFNPSYYNTVDQIYHARWSVAKLGRLALLRRSVEMLWPQGHPTRLIQVAGTSGKGSTCRFLEAGLACLGKAGAFLGPHLFDYRERFSIDGTAVTQDAVTQVWETTVKPHLIELALENEQHLPTFHEVNILMALALFDQQQVDWAAIETGVGGRYDQATALEVVATALTNVGRDHEHLLGPLPWQRALDKAGVVRQGVPLFSSAQDDPTRQILAAVCRDQNAPLHTIAQPEVDQLDQLIAAAMEQALPPEALLTSEHQRWNAALSLAVLRTLFPEIDPAQVIRRMLAVRFVGRFWQVAAGVYADIAHNPEKLAALAGELTQKFSASGKIFVVGVSGKRSAVANLAPLVPVAKAIIVTGVAFKGQELQLVKKEVESIRADIPVLFIAESQQAVTVAQAMRHATDIIILTGSTYMIDQLLNPDPYLQTINATWGWRARQDTPVEGTLQFILPRPPER